MDEFNKDYKLFVKEIDGLLKAAKELADQAEELAKENKFPFTNDYSVFIPKDIRKNLINKYKLNEDQIDEIFEDHFEFMVENGRTGWVEYD